MVLNEIARRIDAADGGSASGASGRLATACPGSCQRPHPGAGRRASAAASPRPWPRCWAFFLGTLGVHRFYLGSRGFGLVLDRGDHARRRHPLPARFAAQPRLLPPPVADEAAQLRRHLQLHPRHAVHVLNRTIRQGARGQPADQKYYYGRFAARPLTGGPKGIQTFGLGQGRAGMAALECQQR